MSIDTSEVFEKMVEAAKGVFDEKWPETKDYAESEAKIFAERFANIARLRLEGKITEKRAKLHLEFQKDAWETVLLAIDGLNQLLIEKALNAALDAVKDIVNTAVGFVLL
jgi:hypothetical protein